MAKEGGKFIQLSEISGSEVVVGKKRQTTVTIDMETMPNYTNEDGTTLQENIGFNFRALRRRALLSDMVNVRIVGVAGKTSKFTPAIVGSSEDQSGNERTAVAAKTGVMEKVSTYETAKEGNTHIIKLNISEIAQKVSDKATLRSADAWAREMNTAIENAFFEHQLRSMLNRGQVQFAGFNVLVGAVFASGDNPLEFVQGYSFMSAVMNAALVGTVLAEHKTFITPFNFERTLISSFVSHKDRLLGTQSLVRALPQEKN